MYNIMSSQINTMLLQSKVYHVSELISSIKVLNKISEFSDHFSSWLTICAMVVSSGTGFFGYTILSYISSSLSAVSLGFARYSTYTRGRMKENYKKLRAYDTTNITVHDDDSSDLGTQFRDIQIRDQQLIQENNKTDGIKIISLPSVNIV